MNLFSMYKMIKDNMFVKRYENHEENKNIVELQKASGKRCASCLEVISACEIHGKRYTKKQMYNKMKKATLDGKIRCRDCQIKWLEMKIDELI